MQIPVRSRPAMKIVGTTAAVILLLLVTAFAFSPRRDLLTTIDVAAPPSRVWAVLADTASYPQWNPHMRLAGRLVQGNVIEHVEIDGNDRITFRPRLLVVRPDRELRWLGRITVPGVLDAEHFFPASAGRRRHPGEPGRAPSRRRLVVLRHRRPALAVRPDEHGLEDPGGTAACRSRHRASLTPPRPNADPPAASSLTAC